MRWYDCADLMPGTRDDREMNTECKTEFLIAFYNNKEELGTMKAYLFSGHFRPFTPMDGSLVREQVVSWMKIEFP